MYHRQNAESIKSLFASIAPSYDKTNGIISLGMHYYWNQKLIAAFLKNQSSSYQILDLCAGTGEITRLYCKKALYTQNEITLLDFCKPMLDIAEKRLMRYQNKQILEYVIADAENIPAKENKYDIVWTAYGIRNVLNRAQCVQEVFRVLKKGGSWGILELSKPSYSILEKMHHFYLKKLLPCLGKWMTDNQQAYEYLSDSIHAFISPQELYAMLKQAGFKNIYQQSLSLGAVSLTYASK